MSMNITPTPTDEEAAAIAAAVMTTLSSGGAVPEPESVSSRWRFSGRWWRRGHAVHRNRPYLR